MKICDKAKTCHSAPSCQHGHMHRENDDCLLNNCQFGGKVKCVDYQPDTADNDWRDNEVHHEE